MPPPASATFRIITHGSRDYEDAVRLREAILRKPLGLSFSAAELAAEKGNIHIAGFLEGRPCASAMLVPQGSRCKMQRVAVEAGRQGTGIGSAMLAFCEELARARGFREMYCHARSTAVPFYLKHHYAPEGEEFEEQTIPHRKMRKRLAP